MKLSFLPCCRAGALLLLLCNFALTPANGQDWPQGSGPKGNYQSEGPEPPPRWSVSTGENILWKQTLPEAGQSGIAIVGDKLFLTVKKPLPDGAPNEEHSTADVLGLCLDVRTGRKLWDVFIPGTKSVTYVQRFISEPTPIADDKHVWFSSSTGGMMCLDHSGREIWRRVFDVDPLHAAQFCQPMMVDGKFIHVALKEPLTGPINLGKSSGQGPWSCLHAYDAATCKPLWKSEAATSVFSAPGFGKMGAQTVVFHGRGGAHNPPETPYGFSLTSADTGKTVWNCAVKSGFSFFPAHLDEQHAFVFDNNKLLQLDLKTGQAGRSFDLTQHVDWYHRNPSSQKVELQQDAKFSGGAHPSYHSSILAGRHVLFMAHNHPSIGRVNIESGKVEYLHMPYQVVRKPGATDQALWDKHIASTPTNSRGMNVSGDKRELHSGWGHVTVPAPIAVNGKVYFVTMIGTVYVVDANAKIFDATALQWVGDLGPAGQTWTLASLSYANGRLYARTLKEVVCIGK
jgi:outer membrane protein assembly factor BamB